MDQSTEGQLRVIREVLAVTQSAGIPVWLFGGWGLDARIGRITREHGDVEFWVERIHADRSKAVLFPHLRNGRPWRQKDVDDIEILRGLAAEGRAGK
jgi:hypothetical protein